MATWITSRTPHEGETGEEWAPTAYLQYSWTIQSAPEQVTISGDCDCASFVPCIAKDIVSMAFKGLSAVWNSFSLKFESITMTFDVKYANSDETMEYTFNAYNANSYSGSYSQSENKVYNDEAMELIPTEDTTADSYLVINISDTTWNVTSNTGNLYNLSFDYSSHLSNGGSPMQFYTAATNGEHVEIT